MSNATVFLLTLAMFAVVGGGLPRHEFAGTAYAQWHNQNSGEARVRKNKAQKALLQAMELNARVEVLIKQGSDDVAQMNRLLDQSYSLQAVAINAMEGVNRMAKFKDPLLERGISDMYGTGKPATLRARSDISAGAFDSALEDLAKAKVAHQRFLIVTY